MPEPKIHEQIDLELFGKSYFKEVHSWIDGTFNGTTNGRIHWVNRHYVQAILEHFNPKDYPDEEEREKLILISKIHILLDWAKYYNRIVLPKTRGDVIRELKSHGIFIDF